MAEAAAAPTTMDVTEPATETIAAPAQTNDVAMGDVKEESDNVKLLRAVRQIEFYFSDSNLPYDRFMWTLHSANDDHYVPIKTVASFKRMKEFAGFPDGWLVDGLRTFSKMLDVNADGDKVRRVDELVERNDSLKRSIYAKGFGEDEYPGMQAELERFFNQYGHTNQVRMRRMDTDKKFKGSVFAEFADLSTVNKFLTADPKPKWKDTELLIMSKEAYCEMKIKEKGLTGKAAKLRKESMAGAGTTRKGFNAFREMEKAKTANGAGKSKSAPEVYLEFMGTKLRVHANADGVGYVKEEEVPHVKGATLRFDGCGADVKYSVIKEPLNARFERKPFIKFERGEDHGLLGFDVPLSEEDIAFVKEHVPKINDKEVTWSIASDEQEKALQIERADVAARAALGSTQQSKGGRGGSRGGRGGRGASRGGSRGGRGSGGKSRSAENGTKKNSEKDAGDRNGGIPEIASAKKPTSKVEAPAGGEKRKREDEGGDAAEVKKAKVDDAEPTGGGEQRKREEGAEHATAEADAKKPKLAEEAAAAS